MNKTINASVFYADREIVDKTWDVIIIGGGITGAGLFREASRRHHKTLLIEKNDFASGTSSASSKMVHGGLRYLKQGNLALTKESVNERDFLLANLPGLVNPLSFIMPLYHGRKPNRWMLHAGLTLYDMLSKQRPHQFIQPTDAFYHLPNISQDNLIGCMQYQDAITDDSRLTLRTLQDGVNETNMALNYCGVEKIDTSPDKVTLKAVDYLSGKTHNLTSAVVINATGSNVANLEPQLAKTQLRFLQGSHFVLPAWRLPVSESVTFFHPEDGRPVYIYPWAGVTLVGTTDIDANQKFIEYPKITQYEYDYLLDAINMMFPRHSVTEKDIISTFSGIRSVINSGAKTPSSEKRDSLTLENGRYFTITGGKLTTFRQGAKKLFDKIEEKKLLLSTSQEPFFGKNTHKVHASNQYEKKLYGFYGQHAEKLIALIRENPHRKIPQTDTLWCQIPYALQFESVHHLSDLLLRRTRIGLLLPHGGSQYLDIIKSYCQKHLAWSLERWNIEKDQYLREVNEYHSPIRPT